jgi:hypothetical protein
MTENGFKPTRRSVLGALTAAPAVPWSVFATDAAAAGLPKRVEDELPVLRRTNEQRSLSRFRYHNAESFFERIERGARHDDRFGQLYAVGIVLQLGLSSHLLDVGFADAWCARHLGLHVNKSLACANATGLGHNSQDLERFVAILSPYGKWRNASPRHPVCDCPFSDHEIRHLTRALLERVHQVTGHPRPRGWRQRL